MKYALASFFALLFSISSFCQKGKDYLLVDSLIYDSLSSTDKAMLDSLLPLYHKAKHDTVRLKILAVLPEYTNDENVWPRYNRLLFEKSEWHLKNASSLSAAEVKAYKKFYGQALQNLGYEFQFLKGDIKNAKLYYDKALTKQRESEDKKGEAITLGNIGLIYNEGGDIIQSLEYFFKSLKIQEEIHDINGMGYSLNNIATSYLAQGDTSKAMEYMKKSLKCREETKDKRGYVITLGNLAGVFRRQGKIDTAMQCFIRVLKIWKELGEKQGIGYSYQNIGSLYLLQANNKRDSGVAGSDSLYSIAMEHLQNALKQYEISSYKQGLSTVLANIGNCYLAQNNIPRAEESGIRSLKEAQKVGFVEAITNSARLLYLVYKKQSKWEEALNMRELYIKMRDSISNLETQKSSFKQQTKYEFEKQQALNKVEHQKELVLAEEEKKRQKIISYSVAGGLLLVVVFAVFIFNRLRVTRKQKQIIEFQKRIVDQKNKHITDSINYAKRIQDSILPTKEELSKCFSDYFILFQPREIVSGDFYWLSQQNEKVIFAVADCTGHGVPGAFMSMIGNTLLNEIVNEKHIYSPAEILNKLHEGITHALHQDAGGSQDDGMDISVCVLDKAKNMLSFSGANRSCFITENNRLKEIKGDIFSIGGAFGKGNTFFSLHEIPVEKNSTVFLFTDGYADQPGGEKRKKFQEKNLKDLLASIHNKPMNAQKEILEKNILEWRGSHNQIDDILLAGIKI